MNPLQLLSFYFLITLTVAIKWNQLDNYDFTQYITEFKKEYRSDEISFRSNIFETNLRNIKHHNEDLTKTWKQGVNKFTDRTDAELKAYLGAKPGPKNNIKSNIKSDINSKLKHDLQDLPTYVDWRTIGIITPVKDQGDCGSCWAFATAETLESHYALETKYLNILSEQQILDCTPNPNQCGGTGGCGGGTAELGFAKIIQMGGLASEWTYPYISYNGSDYKCSRDKFVPVATMTSYVNIPTNDYNVMIAGLAAKGPLVVSVDASSWFSYESGIFDGCNQTNPDLDHAVQLVGIDHSPLGEYWIVRNSWGPKWGEAGYIRLAKSSNVTCGIDLTPGDGDGCKNGPSTEKVCGTCGILYDGVYPII